LFWTIPFAASVILSLFLLYFSRNDRDKKKIMFMLSFAFASVGYSNLMLQWWGVPSLWIKNYVWSFIPVGAAGLIAVISSLLKPKNFDKSFKLFLIALGISILLLAFPSAASALRVPLLCTFAALFLPASIYLFIRKRGNSDLIFFLAFSCFIFSWISLDIGLAEEITVLLTLFAFVFTALMFSATQDKIVGDMASFFLLQKKLAHAKKSKENLKTLLDSVHTGILVIDPSTHVIRQANATATKIIGATRDKIIGATCHKFVCPAEVGHCPITDLNQTVDNSEHKLLTANGEAIPIIKSVVSADIGGHRQLVESFIDITDRKTLEERLARTSDQQTSLMRSSATMIHTPNLYERLHAIVDAIHSLGWRRVALSLRNGQLDVEKPEDLVTSGLTQEEQHSLWANRRPGKVWQERFGPEFQRFKIGEFYYLPWDDPFVREKFSTGIVTSHLKREEMIDWDPDDLLYAPLRLADNRIVAGLSIDDPEDGRRPSKESLVPLELFLHQAAVAIENAQLIERLNEANAEVQKHAAQLEMRVEERTKKLVETQVQLLRAERLAAIGGVAGMVSHDLRSPLSGITSAVYYLKTKGQSKMSEKEKEMLTVIEKSVDRSNRIIGDLLDYSREIKLDRSEADTKSLLEEALAQLEVPSGINIIKKVESEPRMNVDKDKIVRVFINLIKNAIDAMPTGGVLVIKSEEAEDDLCISFTDTGTGISEENLQKLWTPLFTTKTKGMGFGLPICKRFIEAHEGRILVESKVGKGTTFTVRIPIEPVYEQNEAVVVNLPKTEIDTRAGQ
jgi:PAS domain S-box-containing protein